MKFSKIVAAISLVLGTGVAFAEDVDKVDTDIKSGETDVKATDQSTEKTIKKEATLGSAEVNKRACKSAEVFFKFDSAALAASDDAVLQPLVDQVTKFQGTTIVLDGFADPRGSDAYNVVLSGQRSEAVRDRLISMGAPKERIVLSLHGEQGDQRGSYPEDRRVTAWVTRNTTSQIVDHALENNSQALVFGDQMKTIAELHNAGRRAQPQTQAAQAEPAQEAEPTPPAAQTEPAQETDKTDQTEKTDKTDQTEQPEQTEQPAQPEQMQQPQQPEQKDQMQQPQQRQDENYQNPQNENVPQD